MDTRTDPRGGWTGSSQPTLHEHHRHGGKSVKAPALADLRPGIERLLAEKDITGDDAAEVMEMVDAALALLQRVADIIEGTAEPDSDDDPPTDAGKAARGGGLLDFLIPRGAFL